MSKQSLTRPRIPLEFFRKHFAENAQWEDTGTLEGREVAETASILPN